MGLICLTRQHEAALSHRLRAFISHYCRQDGKWSDIKSQRSEKLEQMVGSEPPTQASVSLMPQNVTLLRLELFWFCLWPRIRLSDFVFALRFRYTAQFDAGRWPSEPHFLYFLEVMMTAQQWVQFSSRARNRRQFNPHSSVWKSGPKSTFTSWVEVSQTHWSEPIQLVKCCIYSQPTRPSQSMFQLKILWADNSLNSYRLKMVNGCFL